MIILIIAYVLQLFDWFLVGSIYGVITKNKYDKEYYKSIQGGCETEWKQRKY